MLANTHRYRQDDVNLVINNAVLYNKQGTPHFRAALKLRTMSRPILDKLNHLAPPPLVPPPSQSEDTTPSTKPPVGDLEPPEDVVDLLSSNMAIKDGLNLELGDQDPISCLFDLEIATYKPPPPLSPVAKTNEQKTSSKKKKKRDRKAEYERTKARKVEADAEAARLASQTPAAEGADEGEYFPSPLSSDD